VVDVFEANAGWLESRLHLAEAREEQAPVVSPLDQRMDRVAIRAYRGDHHLAIVVTYDAGLLLGDRATLTAVVYA
jgi:hypothetical protein